MITSTAPQVGELTPAGLAKASRDLPAGKGQPL
jgi:hypothetical protein